MRFGILGETRARLADGRAAAVGGPGRRALLALLLLDAGRVVPLERLIDGLYGEEPPTGVANALQSQVSRLRSALREPIENHPAGYRLVVEPGEVDVHRFQELAAQGREAISTGEHRRAAELLGEALGLWRGPALADVGDAPFASAQIARLEERRLAAFEDRAEAELALGGHRELVAELRDLVAANPLRERLRAQLMRALYGSGRQAEALAVYEEARRELAETLGTDPGPELTAVHLAVLRADPALRLPVPVAVSPSVDVSRETAPSRLRETAGVSRETERWAREAVDVPRETEAGARDLVDVSRETASPRRVLPAQLTSFVGRDEELERVGALLRNGRLVTLLGPGGAGKTRLSVEVAGRHPGECCFVDLAAVTDGSDAAQAVLTALGLRESGLRPAVGSGQEPAERLVVALADRELLLVLDNCEHVVEFAAALTARLLAGCPALRVLATSREALGITGEVLSPVPPLALPPVGAGAEQALEFPAVRLFAERAGAVRPDFDLRRELDAVLRICTALDGLPLAIELAAARLRALSAAEIAARLGGTPADELPPGSGTRPAELFRLLSRGSRTARPRQRTLRGVVDWSWDLLPEAERAVLRRTSVFAGSWSLAAAEAVCSDRPEDGSASDAGIEPCDVLDLVEALVDKSLVVARHPSGGDGVRYRLLETIRTYGAERLAEAGEVRTVRRAHAAHFLGLAEAADPHLRRAEQLDWLARLSADHDNLHAALRRSLADDDLPTALGLIGALSSYWMLRGIRYEGSAPARQLLSRLGAEPLPGLEEEYVACVLSAVFGMLDFSEYADHVAAARAILEELGGVAHRYPSLTLLWAPFAGVPADTGDVDTLSEPLRGHPDPWYQALLLIGRGYQRWWTHAQVAEAERDFTEAVEAFGALGDRWGMTTSLGVLAELAGFRGDIARAVALVDEAAALAAELGSTEDLADQMGHRSAFRLRAGQFELATADCRRVLELARQAGAPEFLARGHLGLAEIARRTGDLAEAQRLCELALAECPPRSFSGDGTRSAVLIALARIALARQETDRARTCLRQALAREQAVVGVSLPLAATAAAEALAALALLEGAADLTAELLGALRALRGTDGPSDPDDDAVGDAARSALGDAAFEAACARGAARGVAEVTASAMRRVGTVAPAQG